jgi:hypothetical protein
MSKHRHPAWEFKAPRDRAGRPLEFHDGIPARNLTERDITALNDEQYATVEASHLYEQTKPPAEKKPAKPAAEAEKE